MVEKQIYDKYVGDPSELKTPPEHIADVLEGEELYVDTLEPAERKEYLKWLTTEANRRGFADLSLEEVKAARDQLQSAVDATHNLHARGPQADSRVETGLLEQAQNKILKRIIDRQLPEPEDFSSLPRKERKRYMQRRDELRAMLLATDDEFEETEERWKLYEQYEQIQLRKEMRGFRAGPMIREQRGLMAEADGKHRGRLSRLYNFSQEMDAPGQDLVTAIIDEAVKTGYDRTMRDRYKDPVYVARIDELKRSMPSKDAQAHITELLTHRYLAKLHVGRDLRVELESRGELSAEDIDLYVERTLNDLAYVLQNPQARKDYDVYSRRGEVVRRHERGRRRALDRLIYGDDSVKERAQLERPPIREEETRGVRILRRVGVPQSVINIYQTRDEAESPVADFQLFSRTRQRVLEAYNASGGQSRLLRAGLYGAAALRSGADFARQTGLWRDKLEKKAKEKVKTNEAYAWVKRTTAAGKLAIKNARKRDKDDSSGGGS